MVSFQIFLKNFFFQKKTHLHLRILVGHYAVTSGVTGNSFRFGGSGRNPPNITLRFHGQVVLLEGLRQVIVSRST
jgi:hypothetical protein